MSRLSNVHFQAAHLLQHSFLNRSLPENAKLIGATNQSLLIPGSAFFIKAAFSCRLLLISIIFTSSSLFDASLRKAYAVYIFADVCLCICVFFFFLTWRSWQIFYLCRCGLCWAFGRKDRQSRIVCGAVRRRDRARARPRHGWRENLEEYIRAFGVDSWQEKTKNSEDCSREPHWLGKLLYSPSAQRRRCCENSDNEDNAKVL